MMFSTLDPVLQWTFALTLALVFCSAAVSKSLAWAEFEGVVQNFRVLPNPLVRIVAWGLPPLESVIGLMVLFPATREFAASIMLLLLLAFGSAIAINIVRGRTNIDCGCFRSALKQNLSWWLVLRNAVLAIFAVLCTSFVSTREMSWADNFVVVMAALALFIVYMSVGYVTLKRPPTFEDNYAESMARRG